MPASSSRQRRPRYWPTLLLFLLLSLLLHLGGFWFAPGLSDDDGEQGGRPPGLVVSRVVLPPRAEAPAPPPAIETPPPAAPQKVAKKRPKKKPRKPKPRPVEIATRPAQPNSQAPVLPPPEPVVEPEPVPDPQPDAEPATMEDIVAALTVPPNPTRARSKRRKQPKVQRHKPPPVAARVSYGDVEATRYGDGSRTVRALKDGAGEPGAGLQGLVDLAAQSLGHGSGRSACNPYRGRGGGKRNLVVLVDSSGSILASKQTPSAQICAAGAALAALKRGYTVTVINFSSGVYHLAATRDLDAIHRMITTQQLEGTRLPPASILKPEGARPNDYVLITDAEIQNIDEAMVGYAEVIKKNTGGRGLLYVLKGGSLQTVARLRDVGFATRFVEEPVVKKPPG